MIYDFTCEQCGTTFEEVRAVAERDELATCECGASAARIFSFKGGFTLGSFGEGYFHAFGKHLTQKHQLKEELARYKGETGSELIEMGNEKIKSTPKREAVDWDGFGRELSAKWQK